MLKLQEIQEKLVRINGAVFQDLCDAFILNTEPFCNNIHRTGSQVTKQKTVKGTPDSYYVLPSGKYVLLEYTTLSPNPKQKLLSKIKDDIDKCVNPQNTRLQLSDLEKITYCINSDLETAEHKELMDYAFDKGVRLDIKSLSTITIGLLSKASPLAKEFLGIAIDSGQILDVAGFIKTYERSAYSTPLSNQFVRRNNDLSRLKENVFTSPITILTGPPGVGKTKLAIALLEQIKQEQLPYELYCIDNKHAPIYDDLKTFLPSNGNFILLIDDANRQITNLKPILGLLKEDRPGKLRIIITVRDYALDEIEQLTDSYTSPTIRLQKFSDEEIKSLLASPDFEIYNERYVKRILEISDGNPRLAIMAAKVAIEKQTLDSLQDVTELYDSYFGMTIAPAVFKNHLLLKTMGIVSFFNSISKENSEHYNQVLSAFSMNPFEFAESLVELEKLELLESSPDMITFRIADQVLGTYFFYFTFFKRPVLDFNIILKNYFISHHLRVRDTIIPANNTFGYTNVYKKIDPYLVSYWKEIANEREKALIFLDIFWLYKQEETLAFVLNKISTLPVIPEVCFVYDEEKLNRNYNNKDDYLYLLLHFFSHSIETLKDALSLAALYVNKVPEQYGHLVKLLRGCLLFDREDETYGFYRQHEFIAMLSDVKSDIPLNLRMRLFYDIVPALMKTSFHVVTGTRKRNSMAFYRYELQLSEPIKELRTSIWNIFNGSMKDYPSDSLLFLNEYLQQTPDRVKDVFTFDRPFLTEIFKLHFTNDLFAHCYIVQKFVRQFKKLKIKGDEYEELRNTFTNDSYQAYLRLSYDYRHGKIEYGEKLSYEHFQAFKEKEIRKSFSFNSVDQFNRFYELYTEIDQTMRLFTHNHNLQFSFDLVLHQAYLNNPGNLIFYNIVAESGNPTRFVAYRIFNELATNINAYREFKASLINLEFQLKELWLNNWYLFLSDEQITKVDSQEFLGMLEQSSDIHYLYAAHLDKFHSIDDQYINILLETIYRKNSQGSRINLQEFFETKLEVIAPYEELVKKTYFQQGMLNNHFDYNYKFFYQLLSRYTGFLKDYISFWSTGHSFSLREHEGLSILWNNPDAATIVEQTMDYLCEKKLFYLQHDICNVMFQKIPQDKAEKAITFLHHYVLKNKDDESRINAAFDCIRHNFPDSLEQILISFLEAQPSFALFSTIGWSSGFMVGNGNTSFGEIRAKEYTTILTIIEKITIKTYRFSEHKAYLKDRIAEQNKYAVYERKRKFLEHDW